MENLHFCQASLARHRQGSPSNLGQTLQLQPQSTWPRATAATAENRVIPRAVIGFWPWATAKVVITPAPIQATASWVTIEGRLFTQGSTNEPKLRMVGAAVSLQLGLRYLALVFVTCCNLQAGWPLA